MDYYNYNIAQTLYINLHQKKNIKVISLSPEAFKGLQMLLHIWNSNAVLYKYTSA